MALVPVITMAGILGLMAIDSAHETIQKQAMDHLISIRENNTARVEGYLSFNAVNFFTQRSELRVLLKLKNRIG